MTRSDNHPTRTEADTQRIEPLERATLQYFLQMSDATTGLVRDNSRAGAPASIAGSGFALACHAVAAERGYTSRTEAVDRVLTALRFLWNAEQSDARDASGYRGFFYHFLDPHTGARHGRCELSSIDSGIAIIGALTAAAYFNRDEPSEREIGALADAIYRRADWSWMLGPDGALRHGWRPGRDFLPYGWSGYNEALFLYILALGSPTHPIPAASYTRWMSTYQWKRIYGYEYVYAGPLFIHQLSHAWMDLRGVQDDFMRSKGIDYFENSRRATYVQREYARRNPRRREGYNEFCWGVSASDGPGPASQMSERGRRNFYGYRARGVPFGADDGTLSPWSVAASLPFAPEIVLPTLERMDSSYPQVLGALGYTAAFNPGFPRSDHIEQSECTVWFAGAHYAIDQGLVVLMLENYRSGLIWRLLRGCGYITNGMRAADFRGGWLDRSPERD